MKHLLLVAALLVSFGNVIAQKIRFTDSSNVWMVMGNTFLEDITSLGNYEVSRDTLMYGYNYRSIGNQAFFREDTNSGKIFFRFLKKPFFLSQADTTEHLYFDYNFKVGDTLKLEYSTKQLALIINSLDSVSLGGIFHKRWTLGGSGHSTFVEGLGTTSGPDFLIFPITFEYGLQLRCFSNHNNFPICSPALILPFGGGHVSSGFELASIFDNTTSCTYKTVGVQNIPQENSISITPNPGNSAITLHLPASIHAASVQITDCTGRIIQRLFTNTSETRIGQYLSILGVYFYSLTDAQTGKRYSGKFMYR